ncbi:hypothetical protein [Dysgonomonas sp. 520]|uniref:hypothetical protein n=1 Tax=Dysgonomonas sp. 520 TaxID=2302931 RepID=UPI0013D1D7EE|nr:hypothetical protein [Dysgonomonas sp. 520]NDW08753.1 hypothetical protein [Dysgonomonas sp. 520]
MSLLIGIKQTDNIRYISVSNEYPQKFDRIVATLRNFYKTSEKVQTLISLGNLNWLGPSPHYKSKGDDDVVNCESKIRDKKLSPGKHGSMTVTGEEEFVKKIDKQERGSLKCCFLFENNQWYILVGGHKENICTIDQSVLKKDRLMEGLEVFKYDPNSDYSRLSAEKFHSWNEVKQKADEASTTYYIFRSDKLLTIITPTPKIPEAQA